MLPIHQTEPEAGIDVPLMFMNIYISKKGIWLLDELPFGTQQFVPLISWVLQGSQIPLWPMQLSINIKGTSMPDSGTVWSNISISLAKFKGIGWQHAKWVKKWLKVGKSKGFVGIVNNDRKLWKFAHVIFMPYRLAYIFSRRFWQL